ncbi:MULTISPECIES: ABC transporter ATP-binding protein [Paenibacillus]|uniref:Urea ABC transporter ATP-binding protein n=1 Tax=Paenibacillus naphthalenovorans TaxID=162209 RepID=A0A0U2ILP0_9BACL|nr:MULTISPECIES: ABC transporter ATP-binding protein [Paenibacillus]ALS21163.1 urea ABC transporter ATP-binding protein [Paenibacillus naphthalenovorans]
MEVLRVEHVTKRFKGVIAVHDISFAAEAGEILGIIGPNGAGKTTLFDLLSGFLRPNEGRILYRGRDVADWKRPSDFTQNGIAKTFQKVKPFQDMTVKENVMVSAFSKVKTIEEAGKTAEEILEKALLSHRTHVLAGTLTIGERKKLELAKALATRPALLLLDEVMGGLSESEMNQVIDVIKSLRSKELTIVIIEHIMKAIMTLSDRIIVINFGQKIAEGTPDEVKRNPEVIKAYLGGGVAFAET